VLFNQDLSYLVLALVGAALVIIICFPIHEFSHAWTAYRLGDSTARYQGRLTLDPRAHFDPVGAAMLLISSLVGFGIGWAKPTPVNPYNLRYGRRGESLVALSGPLSNLLLAAVFAIPVRLIWTTPALFEAVSANIIASAIYDVVWFLVLINVFLFLFNLLPIPPLDGWKVLLGLVDARTAFSLRQFEQYGFVLLIVIIVFGGRIIAPIGFAVFDVLTGGAFRFAL
jgi:Zn-dependent protease